MTHYSKWTSADADKLREIAGMLDEVSLPMANGAWYFERGRDVAEWSLWAVMTSRMSILGSAQEFAWGWAGIQLMRVAKEGSTCWYIYSPGNSHTDPGEGFATELDATLAMIKIVRELLDNGKGEGPKREQDVETVQDFLNNPVRSETSPAKAYKAFERIIAGDY